MTKFKYNAIEETALYVKGELGCSLLEAVTKLQATAARNGNEELLSDLCEYKNILIEAL